MRQQCLISEFNKITMASSTRCRLVDYNKCAKCYTRPVDRADKSPTHSTLDSHSTWQQLHYMDIDRH